MAMAAQDGQLTQEKIERWNLSSFYGEPDKYFLINSVRWCYLRHSAVVKWIQIQWHRTIIAVKTVLESNCCYYILRSTSTHLRWSNFELYNYFTFFYILYNYCNWTMERQWASRSDHNSIDLNYPQSIWVWLRNVEFMRQKERKPSKEHYNHQTN